MAITFDRQLYYQFHLFFQTSSTPIDANNIKDLPRIISRQLPNGKSLGLKFGPAQNEMGFLAAEGETGVPVNVTVWRAGSGTWKLEWNSIRLTLTFDAAGYRDIREEEISLHDVKERVTSNLEDAIGSLSIPVNRLAVNLIGQSSCEGASATEVVAESFFNQHVRDRARSRAILDLSGRINDVGSWELPGTNLGAGQGVRVNRIEQGLVQWKFQNGEEQTFLEWRFDANTSPAHSNIVFERGALTKFLDLAVNWISERRSALDGLAG
jgi:hypothetical protein